MPLANRRSMRCPEFLQFRFSVTIKERHPLMEGVGEDLHTPRSSAQRFPR